MAKKNTPVDVAAKGAKKTISKAKSDAAEIETSVPNAMVENATFAKEPETTRTKVAAKKNSKKNTSSRMASQNTTFTRAGESVGPFTSELKERFSAQKIPLQTDFSELIDVADCGRNAVGLNPAQPGGTGAGILLDAEERLAVLPGNGINVSTTGVGVTVEANKGLTVGANGIAVQPGHGVNLSTTGVGVTVEANKGLAVGTEGVAVRLEANKGLIVGANGVAVQPGHGINLSATGVGVTVEANKGLIVSASGIAVSANAGRAILVDSGGVGINYNSTLQVASNQLGVSNSAFNRTQMSAQINTATAIRRRLIVTPNSGPCFVRIAIMANNKQQFTLTLTGSNPYYGGVAVLDISNVYKPSNAAISRVFLIDHLSTALGIAVDLEFIADATVNMNYALSDIMSATIYGLDAATSMNKSLTNDIDAPGQVVLTY